MKKIIEYRTIAFHSEREPEITNRKIQAVINNGFQPFGSPALVSDPRGVLFGLQAFVKYEEEK